MTAFVNGGITDTAKKSNLDSKYGPYESVHAAYTALTSPTDYVVVGLTVGIQTNDGIVEYWFQNGTNESDLVLKVPTVDVPVQSVNSKTGNVVLDNTDVGAAATVHTHTVSDITNFPSLATVATSGNYSDLNGTPTLATVATSGSYSDLTNKPEIPAAQVQTDWDALSGISSIANKPTLATVATSGSYADLSNKPEIPAAQIQSDWGQTDSSKKDFIKNKPTIPSAQVQSNWAETDQTAKSFIQNKPSLATVATTGAYSDLTGTPTIPAAQVQTDWNATSGMGVLLNKPNLATVATTGSYNDLTNRPNIPAAQVQADWTESDTSSMAYIQHKPTIPAAQVQSDWNQTNTSAPDYIKNKPAIAGAVQSDWTENDSTDPSYIQHKPKLAAVATSGDYEDLSNTPTIPTSVSDLSDAADYVTYDKLPYHNEFLCDLYVKHTIEDPSTGEVTCNETVALTTGDDEFSLTYISEETGEETVETNIMFYEQSSGLEVYPDITFSGSTSGISYNDLSNTPTIPAAQIQSDWNQTDTTALDYIKNKPNIVGQAQSDWTENDSSSPAYILHKPTLATVATSGSYNDLSNKPTIPTAQVQTDWNAVSGMGVLLNKPTLATVATSGSYNDLSNKPTIPTSVSDLDGSDGILYTDTVNIVEDGVFLEYHYVTDPGTRDEQTTQFGITATTDVDDNPVWKLTYNSETQMTVGDNAEGPVFPMGLHCGQNNEVYVSYDGEVTASCYIAEYISEDGEDGEFYTNLRLDAPTDNTGILFFHYETPDGEGNGEGNILESHFNKFGKLVTELNGLVTFNGSTSGISYNDLTGTPILATVATSGSYNDLTNTPTIPAAPVQSDWNETNSSSLAYIANKPTIPSISGCEMTANKVTSLTAQSTDTQYPSAKCVYDIVGNIESTLTTILGV